MNIYVIERGFVLVGEPHEVKDNWMMLSLTHCGIIRRWATTQGLGELTVNGPLKETIIDKEPSGTLISKTAIYRVLPCDKSKWSNWRKEWEKWTRS